MFYFFLLFSVECDALSSAYSVQLTFVSTFAVANAELATLLFVQ